MRYVTLKKTKIKAVRKNDISEEDITITKESEDYIIPEAKDSVELECEERDSVRRARRTKHKPYRVVVGQ